MQIFAKIDFSNHFVYEISSPTKPEVDLLQTLADENLIDFWGRTFEKSVLVSLPDYHLAEITKILDKTGIVLEKVHSKSLKDLFDEQITAGLVKMSFHEKYHNLDEIYEYYDSLTTKYPHLTSQFTIGKSFEKREIRGIRIQGINSTTNPKRFVFHAGIHAREWIGPATLTWIAETLLGGYAKDSFITELLDSISLEIIPVLNVDGYEYTHSTNRMWRFISLVYF